MKALRLLSYLLCSIAVFAFLSCEESAPDLRKKEIDVRLIGTWNKVNAEKSILKTLIFKSNGQIIGYNVPGGKKRVFYTENNNHLFVFVEGLGIKLSNQTYDEYYKIDGDKLILWDSMDEMNSNSSVCTIFQKEK